MNSENSPETIRVKFINLMGEELGSVYYKLSYFFYIIQKGLYENVIMSITRITDPVISMGKRNLTLKTLPLLIKDDNLKKEVELQIEWHIDPAIVFAKELRNKRFGHEDFGSNRSTISMLITLQDGLNARDYLEYLQVKGDKPNEILGRNSLSNNIRHVEYD